MSKLYPKSFNYSFYLFSFLIHLIQSIETTTIPIKKRFKKNDSNSREDHLKTTIGFIGAFFLFFILLSCCYGIPCLLIRSCIEKICRRNNYQHRTYNISHNNNNYNYNNNLNNSEENDNNKLILKKKYYLFENIIFPQKVNVNSIKKNEICSICQEQFNINNDICHTPCNHIFHHECLMNYLMRIKKSNCPNCNYDLLTVLDNNQINCNEIIIPDEYEYINWKNEYNKKNNINNNINNNENNQEEDKKIHEDNSFNGENIEITINEINIENKINQLKKDEDNKSALNTSTHLNNNNNNEKKKEKINNNEDNNKKIDNIEDNNKEIINNETIEMNQKNNSQLHNKKIKMVCEEY